MRIDRLEKRPGKLGELPWGAASFYGVVSDGVVVDYDEFVTSDDSFFSMSGGKLHVLAEGTYAFFSAGYIYPSGSPALTTEVAITPFVTADSYGAFPANFYWPDFGMYKVTGYATGTKSWSPHMLLFRTYNDENVSFPTDQYVSFTVPFATSNCIVSTLAVRLSDALPI